MPHREGALASLGGEASVGVEASGVDVGEGRVSGAVAASEGWGIGVSSTGLVDEPHATPRATEVAVASAPIVSRA
jgi:hypothetical protein